jgi:hypothetical protein
LFQIAEHSNLPAPACACHPLDPDQGAIHAFVVDSCMRPGPPLPSALSPALPSLASGWR